MSDNEVNFTASANSLIALALAASALALALSVWSLKRVGEVEVYLAVQAVQASQ